MYCAGRGLHNVVEIVVLNVQMIQPENPPKAQSRYESGMLFRSIKPQTASMPRKTKHNDKRWTTCKLNADKILVLSRSLESEPWNENKTKTICNQTFTETNFIWYVSGYALSAQTCSHIRKPIPIRVLLPRELI